MIILISAVSFLLMMTVAYVIINHTTASNPMTLRFKTIENMLERRSDVEEVLSKSFSERVLMPIGQKISERVNGLTPITVTQFIGKRLIRAGGFRGLSASQFITISCMVIIVLVVASLLISLILKFKILKMVSWILYAIMIGGALPHFMLSRKIAVRQRSIQKDLPNALDLVTVSVEAGLSFDGALVKLGEKMKGALVEEFNHVLQEMRMGVTRREALKAMSLRCGNHDLSLFITALVQADQLGVSIGTMLRTQAVVIRENRKQYIEQKATKAPVHMLFPLALCIFPTLFIVILGPAVLKIATEFLKK